MLISEKTQLPSLIKVHMKKLKEVLELVITLIHNVITNSITNMNNLLYAGANVGTERFEKMKKNKSNEKQKNFGERGEFRQILQSGEKMSVD